MGDRDDELEAEWAARAPDAAAKTEQLEREVDDAEALVAARARDERARPRIVARGGIRSLRAALVCFAIAATAYGVGRWIGAELPQPLAAPLALVAFGCPFVGVALVIDGIRTLLRAGIQKGIDTTLRRDRAARDVARADAAAGASVASPSQRRDGMITTMARTHILKVLLRGGEDGWIVAECPALVGCISQGRTRDEALANVREAIELCLEAGQTPGAVEVTVVEVDAA